MEKAFRLRNSMAKSFKSLLFQQKEHWILSYQKMLCGAQTRKEGHTMFKQRGSHEEMLKKIDKTLPRSDAWFDIGSELDLTFPAETAFPIEDTAAPTMGLAAGMAPHPLQLPVAQKRTTNTRGNRS